MSSTHLSLNFHVIFSTKERRNTIENHFRERLFGYMAGCLKTLNAMPLCIGGVNDHVHLLFGIKATQTLSEIVRDVKISSAKWVHQEMKIWDFAWQEGYGGFTVSPTAIEQVKRYIQRQEHHHKTRTFQEEYLNFLEKAEISYDPKFVW